ncbi:hypothetical protein Vgi01_25960 [Micromonospora gifhornensis]|uniref:Uncharacterized protein n=1 Tax=Micromonospora gifhornensis TaxID=84594 RepID=A0ABQ4IDD8_9ACTN|nr:hypothetical protein Vgi01_25960 [Micromonospora gifhornensis]
MATRRFAQKAEATPSPFAPTVHTHPSPTVPLPPPLAPLLPYPAPRSCTIGRRYAAFQSLRPDCKCKIDAGERGGGGGGGWGWGVGGVGWGSVVGERVFGKECRELRGLPQEPVRVLTASARPRPPCPGVRRRDRVSG